MNIFYIFLKGSFRRDRTNDETKGKYNTITKDQFMEWIKSIWTMSAENTKRIVHPVSFPEELSSRLIQPIILDPFMGSVTTKVAVIKTKRRYNIGYDFDKEYVKLANSRVKLARQEVNALNAKRFVTK